MSAINALAAQDWAIIPETLQQMANMDTWLKAEEKEKSCHKQLRLSP